MLHAIIGTNSRPLLASVSEETQEKMSVTNLGKGDETTLVKEEVMGSDADRAAAGENSRGRKVAASAEKQQAQAQLEEVGTWPRITVGVS